MGRKMVTDKIRRSGIFYLIIGILMAAAASIALISLTNTNQKDSSIIFVVIFGVLGLPLIFFGIRRIAAPNKSSVFSSRPDLLEMADEHFDNIRFNNKVVTISDTMVSLTDDPLSINYIDEVFLVYIEKTSINFIPTGKNIIMETARGRFSKSITGKKTDADEAVEKLSQICPNAKFGYYGDNLVYLRQSRALWEQKNK